MGYLSVIQLGLYSLDEIHDKAVGILQLVLDGKVNNDYG